MKKLMTICAVATMVFAVSGVANADIQVDFTRVYAPNAYGSDNYDTLWANAQHAVVNGLSSYDGYGGGIGEFKETTEVTGIQSYVTSYESWNGVYSAGEYGGRASWVYHIYDDAGAEVTFDSITKEYFDDRDFDGGGETRHSTNGWGPIEITEYDSTRFVGIKSDDSITTDTGDAVVGFIGLSGNSWWHAERESESDPWDYIKDDSSDYWDDRFTLLAAHGADVEQNQTHWGFEIGYGGETFTAPDIAVVPEPATLSLIGLGGIGMLIRRRRK